jgi:hypothetical protein
LVEALPALIFEAAVPAKPARLFNGIASDAVGSGGA